MFEACRKSNKKPVRIGSKSDSARLSAEELCFFERSSEFLLIRRVFIAFRDASRQVPANPDVFPPSSRYFVVSALNIFRVMLASLAALSELNLDKLSSRIESILWDCLET